LYSLIFPEYSGSIRFPFGLTNPGNSASRIFWPRDATCLQLSSLFEIREKSNWVRTLGSQAGLTSSLSTPPSRVICRIRPDLK
jgi:hypothetical protein